MQKIVIIGANNFQLPLIIQAKKMGIYTYVFAWDKGAIGKDYSDKFYPISIIEKEKILSIARKIKPDGILSIGSDLASITVNYIADKLGLIGNSLQCTRLTTDKYLMRQKLKSGGLPCPKFIKSNKPDEIIKECGMFPLIVKPTDRSGSRGVTKVNNIPELENAILRASDESFSSEFIVEEFVQGAEYSVEMITWERKHYFLQITEKETTGSPYFVEKGQHQPAYLSPDIKDRIIGIVQKSLTCLGVDYGASHSEILITPEKDIYIVEIGARMGGDYIGSNLVQLSTGYNFLEGVINISLGKFKEVLLAENSYSGVYFILPRPGKLLKVFDNTNQYGQIVFKEIYFKIGDQIKEVKESNDRAACYIYKSKSERFIHRNDILELFTE